MLFQQGWWDVIPTIRQYETKEEKYVNYIMIAHNTGCDYKEDIKINYESSLSVVCQFPYGMCSLMTLLEEARLDRDNYLIMSKELQADWEKNANDLDMTILFIQRLNSEEMCKDLELMSAFSQGKYPRNIKTAKISAHNIITR